jgi:isoleucyl-tRNA synthetase
LKTLESTSSTPHVASAILRFDKEWEVIIKRVARWVDFENSYKTMDNTYMESVWWVQKLIQQRIGYEGNVSFCIVLVATPLELRDRHGQLV